MQYFHLGYNIRKKLVQMHCVKLQSKCFQLCAAICAQVLEYKILHMQAHSDTSVMYLPDIKGTNIHAASLKTLLLS